MDQLDELVWQDLCAMLMAPDQITAALARMQGGHWLPHELQVRQENLRKGRVSLEGQLERLTEAYLAAVISLPEYQERRRAVEQKMLSLSDQEQQLRGQALRREEVAGLVQGVEEFCARMQQGLAMASFEQKRQLVELLIDRVVVTDEEVEVRYAIPTSPRGEQVRFCHLRTDYFLCPKRYLAHPQLHLSAGRGRLRVGEHAWRGWAGEVLVLWPRGPSLACAWPLLCG